MELAKSLKVTTEQLEKLIRAKISKKPVRVQVRRKCSVHGCKGLNRAKGFCPNHYLKFRTLEAKGSAEALGWKTYAKPGTIRNLKGITDV